MVNQQETEIEGGRPHRMDISTNLKKHLTRSLQYMPYGMFIK